MPLLAVRSDSSAALWTAFTAAFLAENEGHGGPGGFPSFAWLTHRLQRDALYEAAADRGVRAWLGPPVAFFSELPERFDIRHRPVSLLRRTHTIDGLARRHGAGLAGELQGSFDRPGVGRALDRFFGELLPEGITPDQLTAALEALGGDDFTRRRNAWVAGVYRDYTEWLAREDRYDPRAIHFVLSQHIAAGALPGALGGARRLHIYGPTTLRARRALTQALRSQQDVEVVLYLPATADADEWLDTADSVSVPPSPGPTVPRTQPAPDERRELDFISQQIKRLLVERHVPAHHIGVVARTGREDARAAHETLTAAGIPVTSRVRAALAEVPALKAVALLLKGAAYAWPYAALRQVLTSPYFDLAADLRTLDRRAAERRLTGLATWAPLLGPDLATFIAHAERLTAPRTARRWIATTRDLLDPGWFGFRNRVCSPAGGTDRLLDIVRLDQQAILHLDALLADWMEAEPDGEPVTAREWYARFRRFLGANEIALNTPLRTGVQILEAHEAALFPFAHSFLVHANDGEFPKRPGNPWLFTDAELTALRAAGLPIADRAEELRRERVLWHAVVGAPDVTITYRTADPGGVPLLPSLLVPQHDPETEIPRTRFVLDVPVTAAHDDRRVVQALREARAAGERAVIAVPRLLPVRRAILGAAAERTRQEPAAGAWNGQLRDPWILEELGWRFGPECVWSASRLEKYGKLPFDFLLEEVLKLQQLAEAEEETDVRTQGSVTHALLERFYREYSITGAFPGELDAAASALFDRVATEELAEVERSGQWLGVAALWAAHRRQIVTEVRDFLAWELPRIESRRPRYFELAFGLKGDLPALVAGVDVAGRAAAVRLRGKIDRVDQDAAGLLHVVDYKSSFIPSRQGYEDGATLQAPLYVTVLGRRDLGPAGSAVYLSVRQRKRGAEVDAGALEVTRAVSLALSIPGRVRQGLFEPVAAKSSGWSEWSAPLSVARVSHERDAGSRFDG